MTFSPPKCSHSAALSTTGTGRHPVTSGFRLSNGLFAVFSMTNKQAEFLNISSPDGLYPKKTFDDLAGIYIFIGFARQT
jgi:hypothetical protein